MKANLLFYLWQYMASLNGIPINNVITILIKQLSCLFWFISAWMFHVYFNRDEMKGGEAKKGLKYKW